jgi:branched-chain amino acid transport system ATP-binding protein
VLLGPNGAGKSTCINMLSGDLPPSDGTIRFMGRDITALSAAQRSRVGIGRSYQRTNIFPKFSVLENVRLAAQSRRQQAWRIFSRRCSSNGPSTRPAPASTRPAWAARWTG